ncbi:MAG: UbiA family prenyltransferase [Deltaproteobacteria bacterium]|nr:UbiA family prenyltransferase [Deltaproteobacteria bacterium]
MPLTLIRKYSELVVFSHSIFALPFALAAFVLASRGSGESTPIPITPMTSILVILSIIFARMAAMAFNRLADYKFDALNPRTENRNLPTGSLTKTSVSIFVLLTSALFLLCAALLGPHCLKLAPFLLLILFGYSFTKRFTHYSHLVLGIALALAPGGAWWTLRPEISVTPLLLMATVTSWVAGFDILYSCQDIDVDRKLLLHSVPARYGIKKSLLISTLLHLVASIGLILVGFNMQLANAYYYGLSPLIAFLLGQHFLVSSHDLSKINRAFFTFNGMVSIGYFLIVLLAS